MNKSENKKKSDKKYRAKSSNNFGINKNGNRQQSTEVNP